MSSPGKKRIMEAFPELSGEVVGRFKKLADKDKIISALRHIDSHMDGSYGLEYIKSKDDTWCDTWGIEYVNVVDSYTTTLYWDMKQNSIMLGTIGDHIEKPSVARRFSDV